MENNNVRIINVTINEKLGTSYNIYLGNDLLENIESIIEFPENTLIITDTNIPTLYQEYIIKKAKKCYVYQINPGEDSKNLFVYKEIIEYLVSLSFSRNDLIIALGGGVVGDLAGFVASTYKRGIKFINIPTSTLSMIDSSIGGKVAVNVNDVKNSVGAFYMPNTVIISFDTLKSLPLRHYYNGLMESLKAGLIQDKELYKLFIDNLHDLENENILKEIIEKSIYVKKRVVEEDPYEQGLRKILNFGHTIGHVIESENFNKIFHGEAVLLGMMYFSSEEIKIDLDKVINKLNSINSGALKYYSFNKQKAFELVCNDKKRSSSGIDVICVNEVGKAFIKKMALDELKSLIEGE